MDDGRIDTEHNILREGEFELVEKSDRTFGEIMDELMKDPKLIAANLSEEIAKLKLENKNLQAKIDYLKGQISVYERYLDIKKEEN